MAPTILIVGATGNTGRSVVETLSKLLETSSTLSGYRIVALTRSASSPIAQGFAKLPGVEVIEQPWVEISSDWLRKNEVVRAFIASHTEPSHFAEESSFHVAALKAGVKYVVRISTTGPNVRPDCEAYYPRAHWAIETLLSSPEFEALQFTSLQPNSFSPLYLTAAAEFVKEFRKTGKVGTLRILGSKDVPVGIIDPDDIGYLAARLLELEDTSPHNGARYVINGPEDVTGDQVVKMVEGYIGTKVEDVRFEDLSFIDAWADSMPTSSARHLILSIKKGLESNWKGECSASTTSKEVLRIAAPKKTPAEVLKTLLE
jgi:uncharacterized protein YbjT (DUF2867 family)